MRVLVLCLCQLCVCVYISIFRVPAENGSSASLLAGPGDLEKQQPHLSCSVGSSINDRFLLTAPTVSL